MWTSLKNTETNDLVRINLKTLEQAVEIATAINERRAEDATKGLTDLTTVLSKAENAPFQQKLGLAQWSVRVAQDFLGGTLVAIDENEAEQIATEKAMAELIG